MKKIIIFIILLLLICNIKQIKVRGQEYLELPNTYIEEGIGDETYLYLENYSLVSGTVNWQREGTYNVVYEDSLNNLYNKKYIVLPNEDKQFFLSKQNENEIIIDDFHNIIDIFYINENSFYILSNYQIEDPTAPDQEKISVIYYENYEYKWEYRYYKFSRYVSACLNKSNIIITGLVYNENNFYINSIVLFEITKDRQIIKSREVISDKSCYVYGLYTDSDYIYLITLTNGNKYDYEKYKKDTKSRIVIFKLSYQNFQIISGVMIEELENFIFVDTSFYNRRLTVNVLLKEKQGIYTNCIYEYNDLLQYVDKYYFTINNKDYLGHQVTENDLCFYSIDHSINNNCVKIEYLNNGVENKNILLDLQNIYFVNNVDVVNIEGNDIYFSMKNIGYNTSYFLGFCKVNSIFGVSYFSCTTEEIGLISTKITNGILLNFYYKQDKIYSRIIDLIEIETVQSKSNIEITKAKKMYHNCKELLKSPYKIRLNKNVFGKYQDVYFYIDELHNKYFLSDEYEVVLQCNVLDDMEYQIGYSIKFNGIGTLNGNEVFSGFNINDIGKYQLIINGNNDTKIVFFEINDLTVDHIERPKNNFSISFMKEYILPHRKENIDETVYDFTVKDNLKNTVPLSLAILTTGIILFLLLRKKI